MVFFAFLHFIFGNALHRYVSKLECLEGSEALEAIDRRRRAGEIDANILDAAQRQVVEHMASNFYPNFLKSEIYIRYVQVG